MNQLSDLAYSIWVDYLDKAEDISPAIIGSWIFSNLGKFNVYVNSNFSIENNTFLPEIGNEEAAILAQMYLVKYFGKLYLRASKGLVSTIDGSTPWITVKDGDSSFTRANPNEIAKNYLSAQKEAQLTLDELVKKYNIYQAYPRQVESDE